MKLTGKENSLELSVVGYQFPDAVSEPYDSNWLLVQLSVSDHQGTWNVAEPCLLTYEVARLADWFDKINSRSFEKTECGFLEPLIAFQVVENEQKDLLRIRFMLEALPAWARDQDEYFIEFVLAEVDLQTASDDLRKQLERYPQRAER